MTNDLRTKLGGVAAMAAPLLLLASTLAYISAGDGMNSGELGGAVQVWAMIGFGVAAVALARLLEPAAPRAAAVLTVVALAGMAGGVGYGIDSVQAELFSNPSIQDTDSAAAPVALQIPGILFPLSLVAIGLVLARTGTAPRWSGFALAAGALLFPLSRIPDVEALAVASDCLLVVALVPLGWWMARGELPSRAAARSGGAAPLPSPA